MEGKVIWKNGFAFDGLSESGFTVPLDTSVEHGGTGTGPSPMEIVLIGLGGCTAMDVISILQKKRQDVKNFEVLLHAERSTEHPKVFTDITLEFVVTGHAVDLESVERAVELSEGKYCSVGGMLKKAATIHTKCTVKEG